MEEKIKIPRNMKTKLKKKIWLYPADQDGGFLVATPESNNTDFIAYKKGILTTLSPKKNKKEREQYRELMDSEVYVDDNILRGYVDDIFAAEFRNKSYDTLLKVKDDNTKNIAYFNFINAYNLYQNGEKSYGNVCCMAIDYAEYLLKKKK